MRLIAFSCSVFLFACGGSTPVRTQYLLRAEFHPRVARVETPARIGLERVAVAPYLNQSGIAIETEAREIRPARNHHWGEPLNEGLRLYLWTEISNALGEEVGLNLADRDRWDYVVDVFVERLHGTASGEAVLVAIFRIEPRSASGEIVEYHFARSQPLAREGYNGLVDAEAALARQLAEAIAAALEDIGAERPGS